MLLNLKNILLFLSSSSAFHTTRSRSSKYLFVHTPLYRCRTLGQSANICKNVLAESQFTRYLKKNDNNLNENVPSQTRVQNQHSVSNAPHSTLSCRDASETDLFGETNIKTDNNNSNNNIYNNNNKYETNQSELFRKMGIQFKPETAQRDLHKASIDNPKTFWDYWGKKNTLVRTLYTYF